MAKEWRASKAVKQAARDLRHNPTQAERRLWLALRYDQISGLRFRRQHPIGPYIVDFYCVEKHLIIEIDGLYHNYNQEHDQARQTWLQSQGYQFLRFTNDEVVRHLESVIIAVRRVVGDDRNLE